MKYIKTLAATAVFAALGTGVIAQAEVQNEAVKARMAAMSTIGQNLRVVSEMARGNAEFDAAAAQTAFATIAETAVEVPALFEAQEMDPESEASEDIWSNWEDFVSKAEDLQEAAAAASESVDSPEALGAAMGSVGGTCGACHRPYQI